MKIKTFTIIIAMFFLASTLSVFAEGVEITLPTVDVVVDSATNTITVTGKVPSSAKGKDKLILVVENEEYDVVLLAETVSVYSEGAVTYAFEAQTMPAACGSGTYTVKVSGRSFSQPATDTFFYTNPVQVYDALKSLVENSATNKTYTEFCSAFEANARAISLDVTYYNKLDSGEDNSGKKVFAELMKTVDYDLPTDYTYAAEVAVEIGKAKEMCRKASGAALFADISDKNEFVQWFDTFYSASEFAYNSKVAETLILNSVKDKKEFTDRIQAETDVSILGNDAVSFDTAKQNIGASLYESALLTVIETGYAKDVKNIFETFSGYFEPEIDMETYNSLEERKVGTVITGIKGYSAKDCKDAAQKFNECVAEAIKDKPSSDSSSGSGGIGGRGEVYLPSEPVVEEKKSAFDDLDTVVWAKDAIKYLYEKGIVNGKSEGVFAPEDFVTRAEFIKMVIVAMGITDASGDVEFVDVSANDWFAPYVSIAYQKKIVNGDENGNFNPNAKISREDMATILHRTVQGGKAVEAPEFADSAYISDYAKTAVDFFAEQGVINGLGDGKFGPKQNATRAETAVMLYRLMKKA